jgi:AcrR family transcriptional regulator
MNETIPPEVDPHSVRKHPRQARAKATVDCLLIAAQRILAKEGIAAFTTNRVAVVAGVSVGSLYQYFPNKKAIAAALLAQPGGEVEAVRRLAETLLVTAG